MVDRLFPLITKIDGKGSFLKFRDSLSIDPKFRKISIEIYKYDLDPHIAVKHSLDVDDFYYLSYLVKSKALGAASEKKGFADFKGSRSDKWPTGYEARVLKIERQPARDGEGFVYMLSIENGPGELTSGGQGAVKMASGAQNAKKALFIVPEREMFKSMVMVEQYIAAFMAHNFAAIQQAHHDWDQPKGTDTKSESAPTQW